jgi:hypothetical protein
MIKIHALVTMTHSLKMDATLSVLGSNGPSSIFFTYQHTERHGDIPLHSHFTSNYLLQENTCLPPKFV